MKKATKAKKQKAEKWMKRLQGRKGIREIMNQADMIKYMSSKAHEVMISAEIKAQKKSNQSW